MTCGGPRATSYARSRCRRLRWVPGAIGGWDQVSSSLLSAMERERTASKRSRRACSTVRPGVGLERDVRPLFGPQERGKTFRGQASMRHPPRWFSLMASMRSPYEADWAPSSLDGLEP